MTCFLGQLLGICNILSCLLVKMKSDMNKFRSLLLLTSVLLSYLTANEPGTQEIKPFSTLASDCSKLESINPNIQDVPWLWLICIYFYYLLVSQLYFLPKEFAYKWPAINVPINVVEAKDGDEDCNKCSSKMPFLPSFLLATWLLNFAGKHKKPKIWLSIFTLGLQTDMLSLNTDVEG